MAGKELVPLENMESKQRSQKQNAKRSSESENSTKSQGFRENSLGCYPRKQYLKQGAIPKTRNFDEVLEFSPVQMKWQPDPYKWYKGQKKNFYDQNYNVRPDRSSPASMSSLDSNSEVSYRKESKPFCTFPFYYVVPKNPYSKNVLPPGTYLVVPQSKISNRRLDIINHPVRLEKFYDNADENQSDVNSIVSDSLEGGESSKKVTKRNTNKKEKKTLSAPEQSKSKCPPNTKMDSSAESEEVRSEQTNFELSHKVLEEKIEQTLDSEGRLTDAGLASLLDQLPYFDERFIREEWSRKKSDRSVDTFVNEMRDRRINEIYVRVLNRLPQLDNHYLLEKIPEIFNSDKDVENFVEMEKLRRKEELLHKLNTELIGVDIEEIDHLLNRVGDSFKWDQDDGVMEFLKSELLLMRATEKRIGQLQLITTILPDVDTSFVLSKLEEFEDNGQDLNQLLEDLLEDTNYPKAIEHDPKAREKQKLWKYYITNYSIVNYLKKVPDPEQYFAEPSRVARRINREAAVAFLENRYPDLDNFQLNQAFTDSGESIVKTCALLDRNYMFESSVDEKLKKTDVNEAFLQEVAFVTHKSEILRYLREERERRENEVKRAQEDNAFFECIVCFDGNVIPSETVPCPDGHITCKDCLIKYVETTFGSGKYEFPCLSGSCDAEYSMPTLEKFLVEELFTKITQRRAADDIDKAAVPGLEKCPSCDYAYVPAPEDKIFTCSNEDCLRVSCRFCKELNHIPLSCKEVERPKDIVARQQVEEAMTEKLVRSCPKCQKKFIKIDGCNKISCPCGTKCCYICLAVVNDYTHFNGQGGSQFEKCPLYSDNQKLHVQDVLQAGVEMKENIMRENPDIHFVHDPTKDDQ